MPRFAICVVLPLLSACDLDPAQRSECPPAFEANRDGACAFSEAAVARIMKTYDNGELVKVNAEPFPQITDSDVMRNVWITPLPTVQGLDTVDLYTLIDPDGSTELPAAFPVGTVIVHERVDRAEGSTVQVRRELGYANEGGGPWWFGKFYEDGTPDNNDCLPCWTCHTLDMHPDTEGLWGVPMEAR